MQWGDLIYTLGRMGHELIIPSELKTDLSIWRDEHSTFAMYYCSLVLSRSDSLDSLLCVSDYSVKNEPKIDLNMGLFLPNNRKRIIRIWGVLNCYSSTCVCFLDLLCDIPCGK